MSNYIGSAVQKLCPQLVINSEIAETLEQITIEQLTHIIKIARIVARQNKRCIISIEDINEALAIKGFKKIYGSHRFKNNKQFEIENRNIFFSHYKEINNQAFTKTNTGFSSNNTLAVPMDTYPHMHWLTIEGVQPQVIENEVIEKKMTGEKLNANTKILKLKAGKRRKSIEPYSRNENNGKGLVIEAKLPLDHVLSIEQKTYLKKIQDYFENYDVLNSFDEPQGMIYNLENDAALQPLVQYLIRFAVFKIFQSIHDKNIIHASLLLILCLIKNEHVELSNYAHEMMPAILNTLLLNDIGIPHTDDHFILRDYAATVLKCAIVKLDDGINQIKSKTVQSLLDCLNTDNSNVSQLAQYGAVIGLLSLDVCDTEPVKSILEAKLISIKSNMYHLHDENKNSKREVSSLYDTLLKSLNIHIPDENGNNQLHNNNHVYEKI